MKLQLAIDRITIEQALEIAHKTEKYIDVFEVGTSLVKDYGMASVRDIKADFPNHIILADIKTMDEGAYEFRAAFNAGADIATVMGAASIETIAACYKVSEEMDKIMMIDLLEVGKSKITELLPFKNAVFCIHTPKDRHEKDLLGSLNDFRVAFPDVAHVAVAGGVQLADVQQLKSLKLDSVIVGSAITKGDRAEETAKVFHQALNQD